jgi:hypothetical protein
MTPSEPSLSTTWRHAMLRGATFLRKTGLEERVFDHAKDLIEARAIFRIA